MCIVCYNQHKKQFFELFYEPGNFLLHIDQMTSNSRSSELTTDLGLEAGHEVDEERMPAGVGRLKHTSLGHQTLHLITCNYVALLQCFYRKIFSRLLVLRQQHLTASEAKLFTIRQCIKRKKEHSITQCF